MSTHSKSNGFSPRLCLTDEQAEQLKENGWYSKGDRVYIDLRQRGVDFLGDMKLLHNSNNIPQESIFASEVVFEAVLNGKVSFLVHSTWTYNEYKIFFEEYRAYYLRGYLKFIRYLLEDKAVGSQDDHEIVQIPFMGITRAFSARQNRYVRGIIRTIVQYQRLDIDPNDIQTCEDTLAIAFDQLTLKAIDPSQPKWKDEQTPCPTFIHHLRPLTDEAKVFWFDVLVRMEKALYHLYETRDIQLSSITSHPMAIKMNALSSVYGPLVLKQSVTLMDQLKHHTLATAENTLCPR